MPPKIKITKPAIIAAAMAIVRESGAGALNARALAARLGCSTQPIFSNYANMEALRSDVIAEANRLYQRYLREDMTSGEFPLYKASGMASIRFAREEPELFKLLFMRDRSAEDVSGEERKLDDLLPIIQNSTGLSREEAFLLHLEMWIFVHGIATMAATAYLDWDRDMTSRVLTDAYEGLKHRFLNKE
ncbi:MAG: WHG domain-containing protein [Oscillospiraceae bacterium]|nr:WHG domain-containing protein [Oscillospiraceae bacterium]